MRDLDLSDVRRQGSPERRLSAWPLSWLLSFVALMAGLAVTWSVSPATMASTFSTNAPNAFMGRDVFFGFSAGLTVFMNAIYLPFGLAAFVRRFPKELWSLPNKDYWFQPANFESFVQRMVRTMAQLGAVTNVLIALVLATVIAYNLGLVGMSAINGVVVAVLVASFGSIIPLLRAFEPPRS